MNRQHILDLLERSKPELQSRFGVTRLALFGSAARDEATETSDVDVLVAFAGPAISRRYFGVQFHLEDLLGRPVDLVTEKALYPELRAPSSRTKKLAFEGLIALYSRFNQSTEFATRHHLFLFGATVSCRSVVWVKQPYSIY